MNDDLDGTTETEDEPPHHISQAQHPKKNQGKGVLQVSASEFSDNEEEARPKKAITTVEDVGWSSDSNGKGAYNQWKNRKSLKRKRAAASTRKAKAKAQERHTGNLKKQTRLTGSKSKSDGKKAEKHWGHESDEGDALVEHTLPDYLQSRRTKFDERTEKLKAAGLRLPPNYDDVYFSDDEWLKDLQERPDFPQGMPSSPYEDRQLPKSLGLIPASIAQWLRNYQVEGTAFLHELFVYQTGGILGDDMGLGKTVQVIAFLTAAFGKTGDERDAKRMRKMRRAKAAWYPKVMVVCPGTLIENWKNEFERWGWWHVDAYHGMKKDEVMEAATSGRLEVMITTYTTYRLRKDTINMIEWDCVIADECHQMKGRASEITQAMNEVNGLCRIGLTGTAIQNSYDELWTLLNWTNPGKFGPISTWKQCVSVPLRTGQSHDATIHELAKARKVAKDLVQNLLPRFFLRRMKTLIADQLPKKSDRVVFCPMTETQTEAYSNIIDTEVVRYIKEATTECRCGSGKKAGWCCQARIPVDDSPWRNHVFPYITHLMKICNHLAVLIPQSSDNQDRQSKNLDVLQLALPDQWRQLYKTRDSIHNFVNPEFCGKWKVLNRLLKYWNSKDDKVLVFSHSVRLLRMLQKLFTLTSFNVSYLDGRMTYEDRAKAVDDFNSDPDQFVFLISTKAGGVGLNITSANKVVVFDPSWNPSHDLQAQDRAYRIGQYRDVEVFRLICTGTIEEIIYARQIYKQQQANIGYTASHERRYFKGVQENKDQKGELFGLINMFTFEEDRVVLRDIVNKTNVAESKAGVSIADINLDSSNATNDELFPSDPAKAGDEYYMSQLATSLIDEAETFASQDSSDKPHSKPTPSATSSAAKSKQIDPISAILAGAGVEYTHFNSEVVGSSKVEASLSRRAQEAGTDTTMMDKHVFQRNTQDRIPSHNGGGIAPTSAGRVDRQGISEEDVEAGNIPWRYHPSEPVRKRQLCEMAKCFKFKDAVEFALVVEGWTQEQRRNCLDRYYAARRKELGVGVKKEGVDGVELWGKAKDQECNEGEATGEDEEGSTLVEALAEAPNEEANRGQVNDTLDEDIWEL